jgi:hypothetical protein
MPRSLPLADVSREAQQAAVAKRDKQVHRTKSDKLVGQPEAERGRLVDFKAASGIEFSGRGQRATQEEVFAQGEGEEFARGGQDEDFESIALNGIGKGNAIGPDGAAEAQGEGNDAFLGVSTGLDQVDTLDVQQFALLEHAPEEASRVPVLATEEDSVARWRFAYASSSASARVSSVLERLREKNEDGPSVGMCRVELA